MRHRGVIALAGACLALCLAPAASSAAPEDDFPGQTVPSLPYADFGPTGLLSMEAGEPDHDGNAGTGGSAWYSWTPGVNTMMTVETCRSITSPGLDTLIKVYTGNAVNTLTPVVGAESDTDCGPSSLNAKVKFFGLAGTPYRIAIDAKSTFGTVQVRFNQTPANDNQIAAAILPPTDYAQGSLPSNDGATKEAGEANHAGNAGGTSVWYVWIAPASGTAVAQTCGGDFDTLLEVFDSTLLSIGSDDNGCFPGSRLSFTATAGQLYSFAVDGKDSILEPGGDTGAVVLDVALPPPNDDFANRLSIPATLPANTGGNNVAADLEAMEPNHGGNALSVWYEWTAPADDFVAFDSCDTSDTFSTRVDVYTGGTPPMLNALSPVATDETECNGFQGKAEVNVVAGTTYLIAVSSPGVGGPLDLDVEDAGTPPPPPPPGGGGSTGGAPSNPIASPSTSPAPKKCKKGQKLKRGKCVKKKRKK
jgi:hypothetical protein